MTSFAITGLGLALAIAAIAVACTIIFIGLLVYFAIKGSDTEEAGTSAYSAEAYGDEMHGLGTSYRNRFPPY